jgi:hypothetical protein
MLSIDRCRQILGPEARDMSDAQVEQLRDQIYGFADVVVAVVLESRKPTPADDTLERP